jgi:hypothetical protein
MSCCCICCTCISVVATHALRGEASLLPVVFVTLSVKLSCISRIISRPKPLDVARGGRRLPRSISFAPDADAPLQYVKQQQRCWCSVRCASSTTMRSADHHDMCATT